MSQMKKMDVKSKKSLFFIIAKTVFFSAIAVESLF
jgi:hypothetical protein